MTEDRYDGRKRIIREPIVDPEWAPYHHTHDYIEGPQGPQGIKGERGIPGPIGLQGERGVRGEQGFVGERGQRGEKGEKGDRGDTGIKGDQGIPGVRGDPGEIQVFLVYTTKESWMDKVPYPELVKLIKEHDRDINSIER